MVPASVPEQEACRRGDDCGKPRVHVEGGDVRHRRGSQGDCTGNGAHLLLVDAAEDDHQAHAKVTDGDLPELSQLVPVRS